MGPLFKNRIDAARKLAELLRRFADRNPIILGMARGGVLLAAEVGRALNAEVDLLVVRKIGAPRNEEYGVGAVAPNGVTVFDHAALASLGLRPGDLDDTVRRETNEIDRRLEAYRKGDEPPNVANRTAILVDDGLATGITAMAAARYVRSLGAKEIVFAAPVCSRPGSLVLQDDVDEIVCIESPEVFFAVGMWYADFRQVEDDEVIRALEPLQRKEYLA